MVPASFLLALLPAHPATATESAAAPYWASFVPAPASGPSSYLPPARQDETGLPRREFSYTYLDANYRYLDADRPDRDYDGINLRGSLAMGQTPGGAPTNLFVVGSYSNLSDSRDYRELLVGLGYHLPIGRDLDAFATASFAHQEFERSGESDKHEDGLALAVGGRLWLTTEIELEGRVEYRDVLDEGFGIAAGARYHVTPNISLGGEVGTIHGDESALVGVRFQL